MRQEYIDPHIQFSKGWFVSAPNAVLAVQISVACAVVFILVQVIRWYLQACPINPFAHDDRKPLKPFETDQKKRDAVLKQNFKIEKVPDNLDAIIIGSGISALTSGAILAKAGRKVLLLEQHDQAGGSCHTFIDKGYEFDVGVHYLGGEFLQNSGFIKFFLDQISNGQIQFSPMDKDYDVVSFGTGPDRRDYPVRTGLDNWGQLLNERFPGEEKAISDFFKLVRETRGAALVIAKLKIIPLWLIKFIVKTGIINLMSNLWKGKFTKNTEELLNQLTDNEELKAVLGYIWGTYGIENNQSHFMLLSMLLNHYSKGASYPSGGSSEFAYHIIPVIERTGGKVLVRVQVDEILHNGQKVIGVAIKKGSETHQIYAPLVISSAGVYNTFRRLLPPEISTKSYFHKLCKELNPSSSMITVFLGFNASAEELNLPKHNYFWWESSTGQTMEEYFAKSVEEIKDIQIPMFYASFPSAKDQFWSLHPNREDKSTCILITFANWEWFQKYRDTKLKNRGDEYDELKEILGHKLIDQVCELLPQVRHHIDYIDIATPCTYNHYLDQSYGEVYGLGHERFRFDPLTCAKLRPQTDVRGLYLTGQDVMFSGIASNLYAGLLTSWVVLNRNVISDLTSLFIKHKKELKSNKKKD